MARILRLSAAAFVLLIGMRRCRQTAAPMTRTTTATRMNVNVLKEESGSETALAPGAFSVDHDLVSYSSQGIERGLRLSYNSLRADPQPIISSNVTIARRGGVPKSVSVKLYVDKGHPSSRVLNDAPTAGPVYLENKLALNESNDETILTAVQFDAADMQTGVYPFQMVTTNHYNWILSGWIMARYSHC